MEQWFINSYESINLNTSKHWLTWKRTKKNMKNYTNKRTKWNLKKNQFSFPFQVNVWAYIIFEAISFVETMKMLSLVFSDDGDLLQFVNLALFWIRQNAVHQDAQWPTSNCSWEWFYFDWNFIYFWLMFSFCVYLVYVCVLKM